MRFYFLTFLGVLCLQCCGSFGQSNQPYMGPQCSGRALVNYDCLWGASISPGFKGGPFQMYGDVFLTNGHAFGSSPVTPMTAGNVVVYANGTVVGTNTNFSTNCGNGILSVFGPSANMYLVQNGISPTRLQLMTRNATVATAPMRSQYALYCPVTGQGAFYSDSNGNVALGSLYGTNASRPNTVMVPPTQTLALNNMSAATGSAITIQPGQVLQVDVLQASTPGANITILANVTYSMNLGRFQTIAPVYGNVITVQAGDGMAVDFLQGATAPNVTVISNFTVAAPYALNTNVLNAASGNLITIPAPTVLSVAMLEVEEIQSNVIQPASGTVVTVPEAYTFAVNNLRPANGSFVTLTGDQLILPPPSVSATVICLESSMYPGFGTISQSGITVTSTVSPFSISIIGACLSPAMGAGCLVTGYTDENTITCSVSQSYSGSSWSYGLFGTGIDSVGNAILESIYGNQMLRLVPGSGNAVEISNDNGGKGLAVDYLSALPGNNNITIKAGQTLHVDNIASSNNNSNIQFFPGNNSGVYISDEYGGAGLFVTNISSLDSHKPLNLNGRVHLDTLAALNYGYIAVFADMEVNGNVDMMPGNYLSVDKLQGTSFQNVNFTSNATIDSGYWLNANNLSASSGNVITVAAGQVLRVDTLEATTPGRNITIIGNFSFGSSEVFFNKVSAVSGNSVSVAAGQIWKTDFIAGTTANNVTFLSNLTVAAGFWLYANELAAQTGNVLTVASTTTLAVNTVQPSSGNAVSFGTSNLISVGTVNATVWQPVTGTVVTIPAAYTLEVNAINPATGNSVSFGSSNLISVGTVNATILQPPTGTVVTVPAAYTLEVNAINPTTGNSVSFGSSNLISVGTVNATVLQPPTGTVVTIPAAYTLEVNAINPATGNSVSFGSSNLISVGTVNVTVLQPPTGTVVTIPAAYTLETNAINPTTGNSVSFGSSNLISVGTVNATVLQPPTGTVVTIPAAYTLEVNAINPATGNSVSFGSSNLISVGTVNATVLQPPTGTVVTIPAAYTLQTNAINPTTGNSVSFGSSNLISVGTVNATVLQPPAGTTISIPSGYTLLANSINPISGSTVAFGTGTTLSAGSLKANFIAPQSGFVVAVPMGDSLSVDQLEGTTTTNVAVASNLTVNNPFWLNANNLSASSGGIITVAAGQVLRVDTLEATTPGRNITIIGNFSFGTSEVFFNKVSAVSGNSITVNAGEIWKTDYIAGTTANNVTFLSNLTVAAGFWIYANELAAQTGNVLTVAATTTLAVNTVQPATGNAVSFGASNIVSVGTVNATTWQPPTGTVVTVPAAYTLQVNNVNPVTGNSVSFGSSNLISVGTVNTTVLQPPSGTTISIPSAYTLLTNTINPVNGASLSFGSGTTTSAGTVQASTAVSTNVLQPLSLSTVTVPSGNTLAVNALTTALGGTIAVASGKSISVDQLEGTTTTNVNFASNLTVSSPYWLNANNLSAAAGGIITVAAGQVLRVDTLEATTPGRNITIIGNFSFGSSEVFFNKVSAASGNSIAVNAGEIWKTDFVAGTSANNVTVLSNLTVAAGFWIYANELAAQTGSVFTIAPSTTLAVNNVQPATGNSVSFGSANLISVGTLNATTWQPPTGTTVTIPSAYTLLTNTINPASGNSVSFGGSNLISAGTVNATTWQPATGTLVTIPAAYTLQTNAINPVSGNAVSFGASNLISAGTVNATTWQPVTGTVVTIPAAYTLQTNAINPTTGNSVAFGSGNLISVGTVNATTWQPATGTVVTIPAAYTLQTNAINPTSGNSVTFGSGNLISVGTLNTTVIQPPTGTVITIPSAYTLEVNNIAPAFGSTVTINGIVAFTELETNTITPATGTTLTLAGVDLLQGNNTNVLLGPGGLSNLSLCIPALTTTVGTINQTGTSVTGVGTAFQVLNMVGGCLLASTGQACFVTAVTSTTQLTCANSQTIPSGTKFQLGYGGNNMDGLGNIGTKVLYTGKIQPSPASATITIVGPTVFSSGAAQFPLGVQASSITPYSGPTITTTAGADILTSSGGAVRCTTTNALSPGQVTQSGYTITYVSGISFSPTWVGGCFAPVVSGSYGCIITAVTSTTSMTCSVSQTISSATNYVLGVNGTAMDTTGLFSGKAIYAYGNSALTLVPGNGNSVVVSSANGGIGLSVNQVQPASGSVIAVAMGNSLSVDQLEGTTTTNITVASNLTIGNPYWLNTNNISAASGGVITVAAGQILRVDTLEATTAGRNITIIGNFSFGTSEVFFNKVSAVSGNVITVNAGETWKTDYLAGTTSNNITVLSNLTVAAGYSIFANALAAQTGSVFTIASTTTLAVNSMQPTSGSAVTITGNHLVVPPVAFTGSAMCVPRSMTAQSGTITQNGYAITASGSSFSATIVGACLVPALGSGCIVTGYTSPTAVTCSVYQSYTASAFSYDTSFVVGSGMDSSGTVSASNIYSSGTLTLIPNSGNYVSISTANGGNGLKTNVIAPFLGSTLTLSATSITTSNNAALTLPATSSVSAYYGEFSVLQPQSGTGAIAINSPNYLQAYQVQTNTLNPQSGNTVTIGQSNVLFVGTVETNTLTAITSGGPVTVNASSITYAAAGTGTVKCVPNSIVTTGTVSQSGYVVTGTGFTSALIGACLIPVNGAGCIIVAYTSATSINCSVSQTYTSSAYSLGKSGTAMDSNGNLAANAIYADGTNSLTVVPGSGGNLAISTANGGSGLSTNAIQAFSGTTVAFASADTITLNTLNATSGGVIAVVGTTTLTTNTLNATSGGVITIPSPTTLSVGTVTVTTIQANIWQAASGSVVTIASADTLAVNSIQSTTGNTITFSAAATVALNNLNATSGGVITIDGNTTLSVDTIQGTSSGVVTIGNNGRLATNYLQSASTGQITIPNGNTLAVNSMSATSGIGIHFSSNLLFTAMNTLTGSGVISIIPPTGLAVNLLQPVSGSSMTFNGSVIASGDGGIGTVHCVPNSIITTGTISQSGNTITGTGFSASMVGACIIPSFGAGCMVTGYISSTMLTCSVSQTYTNNVYQLGTMGSAMDSNGNVAARNIYADGTNGITLVPGSGANVAVSTANGGVGLLTNNIAPYSGSVITITSGSLSMSSISVNTINPQSGYVVTMTGNLLNGPSSHIAGNSNAGGGGVSIPFFSQTNGLITQNGTYVTITGATFNSGMVCGLFVPSGSGASPSRITAYINSTVITVHMANTISTPSTYEISYGGAGIYGDDTVCTQQIFSQVNGITLNPNSGNGVYVATGTGLFTNVIGSYSGSTISVSSNNVLAVNSIAPYGGSTVISVASSAIKIASTVPVQLNTVQPSSGLTITHAANDLVYNSGGSAVMVCLPHNLIAVANTITIAQTGTFTVTATGGAPFNSSMIGGCLLPASASSCVITAFLTTSTVNCSIAQTYSGLTFSVGDLGTAMDSAGALGAKTIYADDSTPLTLVSGPGNPVIISTANGGTGLQVNNISPATGSTTTIGGMTLVTPSAMYVGNNNGGGGGLGLCFSEYSTGTVTLSGNDVYGIGTTFVVGMVGGLFNPTTGVQASRIAYFLNATHIQVAYPWNYSPITTAYSICWGAAGMFSDASMTAQSHYSQGSITMYPYTGSTFTVSNAQGGLGQTWTNNVNSYSPTPYNYYEEINTLSMTWTGPYSGSQGAQAGNIAIVRSGSMVTLKFAIPPIVTTGGYSSRIASVATLPARHSPTATLSFIVPVQANGTQVAGYMEVHSNGQIYIYSTPVFGNFLVASLTGVPGCSVNYIVGF